MGDWMISKKRFWGLALPIWVCDSCGHFDVIGGREELKRRALAGWEKFEGHTPHRPWVDLVKVRCEQCGGAASRIPDVGNPWLDAGIVPFSTMGYNRDRAYWEKWFPADFITESFPGQFRNWFYAILAMSTMMERRAPFQVLLGHGLVRDQWDRPMHKSAGNAIPFEGAADAGYDLKDPKGVVAHYPAMSADLIRWLFCRSNPAANIDFGPAPAEELRARFTLKLWNTYAFFVNYARLDQFDPAAPQVPVHERPDIDRWVLSDLQQLVRTARRAFDEYNVMAFCLEAEKFIDDKLSNWYVRRNRRRFWKSEHGQDKQAAYQTLYTVLLTLTKLCAPVMPFLTETMYQNLKTAGDPESVHLCDYPAVDKSLVDEQLSAEMDALLDVVSLGLAARNSKKIKVRQPLAEMRVDPANESARRAVERFADQITEELNLKRVALRTQDQAPLVQERVRLNKQNAGPKYGSRLKDVEAALARTDVATVVLKKRLGELLPLTCPWGTEMLTPPEVDVEIVPPEGWAEAHDTGILVIVDCRLSDELRLEGMAREVVRHVQNTRKEADLQPEDRIVLWLHTDSGNLRQAIDAHRDYIAAETLTVEWSPGSLNGQGHGTNVKVDGQPLRIELSKAPTTA
jgi:isoleucyl-tRNA synthetase